MMIGRLIFPRHILEGWTVSSSVALLCTHLTISFRRLGHRTTMWIRPMREGRGVVVLTMVLGVVVAWTVRVESTAMCRFVGKVGGG